MTLFDGITARVIETPRLSVGVLERDGDDAKAPADRTIVFVHGSVGSAEFWQKTMLALPLDLRLIAIDLRGYGRSETLPVDATRGLRDFADDVYATFTALGIDAAHMVGWSMGGGVVMQYALEHPVLSMTLQAPISPYGFGGTRRDGSRLTADDAGTGAGIADAAFVQAVLDEDESLTSESSPRSVFRSSYISPEYVSKNETVWVESMLSTAIGDENFPGATAASDNWPGFAPAATGVLNAIAPQFCNLSSIVELAEKPPVLWVHGDRDIVISDTSMHDSNYLGQIGKIDGWPGADVAPPHEMVSQTRDVLDAYAKAGGHVIEALFEGVGHAPHLEEPEDFRAALLSRIDYVRQSGPPTEAIVLRSAD